MFSLLLSLAMFVIDFFKSPRRLEVENLFLRHQLSIALRRAQPRLRLRGSDLVLGHGRRQLLWFEVTRHRRPSGWPDRLPRPFPGHRLPPTWCGTTTALVRRRDCRNGASERSPEFPAEEAN